MIYFVCLVLAVGLGVPIAVLVASHSQAKAGKAAFEGIARQPEAAGPIQMAMIITLALIESLVLYCLLIFFMLQMRLPDTEKIIELLK